MTNAAMCWVGLLTLAVVFFGSVDGHAEDPCNGISVERRESIEFRPFPMVDPETGVAYNPDDVIELEPGRLMTARQYFDQLNELEAGLNELGYSIRDSGTVTLQRINQCLAVLQEQKQIVNDDLPESGTSTWSLDQQMSALQEKWEEYKDKVPTWDRLVQYADSEEYEVYMPEVPPFNVPVPEMTRVELAEVVKERSWAFDLGSKDKLWTSAGVSLRLEASKLRAKASAQGGVRAALLGKWEGDVLVGWAEANVGDQAAAALAVQVRSVGRTLFAKSWHAARLKVEKDYGFSADKSFTQRFSVGPVPMAARIGFHGGVGIKVGYQIVPIQVGAYAVPYAHARVYAQVGVDVGVAGGGVGGDLVLVADHFTVSGHAGLSFEDEPVLTLELTGRNTVVALAGEFYVFAYVDYLVDRWEGRFTLFAWEGLRHDAEIFRFRTVWSPSGVTVQGDATAEDLLEADAVTTECNLAAAENDAASTLYEVMRAVATDIVSEDARTVVREAARLSVLDEGLDTTIDAYLHEVNSWLVR